MNTTFAARHRVPRHLGACCHRHAPSALKDALHHRHFSSNSDQAVSERRNHGEPLPFTNVGVRPALARALASSFNVTTPTPLQAELLSLLSRAPKRDLIVRNATGSGKSFALAVGLLNAPRTNSPCSPSAEAGIQPSHLLIVPHPDLAHQLTAWIHQMVPEELRPHVVASAVPGTPDPTILDPHILIGTPSRLLDMVTARALDPSALGTVALDEVDQMTPPIPRWDAQRAAVRRRHPKPVEALVAQLAARRAPHFAMEATKTAAAGLADIPTDDLVRKLTADAADRLATDQFKAWLAGKPRVVAVSATASSTVRTHLVSRLKWMHPRRYAFVDGEAPLEAQRVRHCALVIAPGKESVEPLSLLDGEEQEAMPQKKETAPVSPMDFTSSLVAYARATHVSHALVVVLGEFGVNRVVEELNKLFNVRAAIWSSSSSRPSHLDGALHLDVVSYGGIRGLDMPELTHVCLVGAPADVSEYQHIAGRVGRLGSKQREQDAQVVTFCDAKGGDRLRQIWRWMGPKRAKVEMVDKEVTEKVKHGGTV